MSGIEFDPAKDAMNVARHGLSLADFVGFDSDPVVKEDSRYDYGETRYIAIGRIDGLPHLIVYTRRGDKMRLIGFRRAHEKELRRHEKA